jgi:hypothetical protein
MGINIDFDPFLIRLSSFNHAAVLEHIVHDLPIMSKDIHGGRYQKLDGSQVAILLLLRKECANSLQDSVRSRHIDWIKRNGRRGGGKEEERDNECGHTTLCSHRQQRLQPIQKLDFHSS